MTKKFLKALQKTRFAGLVIPILIVTVWEAASHLHMITTMFLPAPSTIFLAGHDLFVQRGIMFHVRSSVSLVLRGFFLGTVTGFLAGVACGLALTAEKLFSPLLNCLRQVPTIAWLPVIAFAVGHEDLGKLTIIALTVFFPVFINTLQGITHVSAEHIEVARIYGFTRWNLIRRVIFPESLPIVFTGIRYGAGMSWAMILVSEMFSGRTGLGYLLSRRQELLVVDESMAILAVIGSIGFLIDYAIFRVERRVTRWNQQQSILF